MSALHVIDNLEYAKNFKETRATITGCDVYRLSEAGVQLASDLAYVLRGMIDEQGRPILTLRVQANIILQCQRCLESFEHAIELNEKFVVLQSEAEIELLEGMQEDGANLESDALNQEWEEEYIAYSDRFNVIALVEDGLLLSVPYSPRHQEGACSLPADTLSVSDQSIAIKPNPFSVLAALKGGKTKD